MGFLDDKVGGKKTIKVTLIGLMIAIILAVLAPEFRPLAQLIFGGSSVPGWLTAKNIFWFAAILIGVFSGPNQASSRSLMGRFTPENKKNEFFGFFAFSGKATAFLGPFLLGSLTMYFESQRVGISVIFLFFLAGLIILNLVDEEIGMKHGSLESNE
jgi:UMF1 family MFS transporter